MKQFLLNMDINKYLHQNHASVVESFDGCLIDNYLAYSNKAIIAIMEEYVNCWTSRHHVYHAKLTGKDAEQIESMFYKRQAEAAY